MTNSTMKTCTKCGLTFPATAEYFNQRKDGKDGLNSQCKKCKAARHRQYHEANREKRAEYYRQWHEANPEYYRQYREANREKIAEYRKQGAEYHRQYYEANREQMAERGRQYYEANPEKSRINSSRRRARKQGLPDTFTSEQWTQCLEYFNYTCPVCDNQLRDLFGDVEPHADHWIPLSYEGDDNPGTVAQNMICLCNDCNLSKGATMPDVWLKQKFGTRKAKQISARIEAYFEWVCGQEGRASA